MQKNNNFDVQIDNCSESELKELFLRLNEDDSENLLNSLKNNIKKRKKQLDELKQNNLMHKNLCFSYLNELWECVPNDDKKTMAEFFKQKEYEIKKL